MHDIDTHNNAATHLPRPAMPDPSHKGLGATKLLHMQVFVYS